VPNPYGPVQPQPGKDGLDVVDIYNGKLLNQFLQQYTADKARLSGKEDPLPAKLLQHLNVTRKGGSPALLRSGQPLQWPEALVEVISELDRKQMEQRTRLLVDRVRQGQNLEPKHLQPLRAQLNQSIQHLIQKANDLPATSYISARRFLNELQSVYQAAEQGDVRPYFQFQEFVAKPRTLKEVFDYMGQQGLHFAPALDADLAEYRAVHQVAQQLFAAKTDGN
jgi:hypothetical protein